MLRKPMLNLYEGAVALNRRNIVELVSDRPYTTICDLGCDDGEWTSQVAQSARSQHVFGVELVHLRAQMAEARGVRVSVSDLDDAFPFENESFDLVHANQVIEHLGNVDHFLAEINRVLRTSGVAVLSTENGSSWHNIFAATMGWQIFSLSNVSALSGGVGNPLALLRGTSVTEPWTHKTIFNYRGLLEIVGLHGMKVERVVGAGYYPLPAGVARFDVRHSHFITIKARKFGPSPLPPSY